MSVSFSRTEIERYFEERAPGVRQDGDEWRGPCPVHKGSDDNFAVNARTGECYCHSQCSRGWDILGLEEALTGNPFPVAKRDVFQLLGRQEQESEITYDYTGPDGVLRYQVVRRPGKLFGLRVPAVGGGWNSGRGCMQNVERVPFQLPLIIKSDTVAVAEGEVDALTLTRLGWAATTNSEGAGKFRPEFAKWFHGKRIAIFYDNDIKGRQHAQQVAEILTPVALSLKVVTLPGLQEKEDVTDFVERGGTAEQIMQCYRSAAEWAGKIQPDAEAGRAEVGSVITHRLADIEAKPVRWLWPDRIARGKVSIIAGNPGLGKSQITASIAAIVTTGRNWPVDGGQSTPGDVVFLSAEDDPADTIRPRLEAAGANLYRVHFVPGIISGYTDEGRQQNRAFSLQQDMEALSRKLEELRDVATVVIDPITAYLGDVDSHRNSEVRVLLAALSELAARHGTAIIGVSHLNKSAGAPEALMRVTGSLAFVAAARAAYLVAQDPGDSARRLFLPMKNNIGPDSSGLAFRIEGVIIQSADGDLPTSKVVWDPEAVTMTADEVMRPPEPGHRSALQEAEDWLREALAEQTPVAEVYRMANDVGISKATLRRASNSLDIVKTKSAMKGGWVWSLPPKVPKMPEDIQQNDMGTFGQVGHLRGPDDMAEVVL